MYTRRHENEAVFTEDQRNRTLFLQSNIKTKGERVNDVNNFIDIERPLHKKCNRIPMTIAQRLISSRMICCVDALVVNGGHY